MDSRRKILVIDDNQSDGDMIARTLKNRGYEVFTETRYQEGLKKAGEVLPDLVFISLLLGTTNGLKASKELHAVEKLRKVPVVMLISYKGELDPKYTVAIGIVDVLVKPLNERDIISKTEAILGPDAIPHIIEEVMPGTSEVEIIGEAVEPEEEYVLDSIDGTDREIIELEEEYHDSPGIMDGEMSQAQEHIHESDDELSGGAEIGGESPGENSFERVTEGIDEQRDKEENYLESMHDEDQGKAEDLGIHEADEDNPVDEADRHGPGKKILIGAVALAIIGVIGAGSYMGLQFFLGGRDRTIALSPAQETSVKDKSDVRKTETGSLPRADNTQSVGDKAQKPAAVASEENIKKEEVPHGPDAVKQKEQVSALKNSPAEKEKKVPEVYSKGTFSVQIGYFGNLKNAEAVADKMKTKGNKVFIKSEESVNGKVFYRVLVGEFVSRSEALEQSKVISREEGINAILYKE
jgi:CheY-like chemotaxis protein/cell division septation protein DedD